MLQLVRNSLQQSLRFACVLLLGLLTSPSLPAQPAPAGPDWSYLLLDESYLLDDCSICGRPSIQAPLRGRFTVQRLEETPLVTRYALEDISFTASGPRPYRVTGRGTLEIGGEVAVQQHWQLALQIEDGVTNQTVHVIESSPALSRSQPMLHVLLSQTNGTFLQNFSLRLAAAPIRDFWFSTASGFTSAVIPAPTNAISGGDLLAASGRVIKRNREFTRRLGIMPFVPDIGLDAVTVAPGGEILYSTERSIFSEFRGSIQEGDLLSVKGLVVKSQQSLLEPFQLQNKNAENGLDALQMTASGNLLFSLRTNVFSQALGTVLQHGDLLASNGTVVRTYQQLLAAFHPEGALADPGLDAVFQWPHGEIWFSTASGFQDTLLGGIQSGDILSDAGYIVFRNLELLAPFAPIEDASNFGLDSLVIISDASPPAGPSRVRQTFTASGGGSLEFFWEGLGQFYQLESAPTVIGPFAPFSPILSEGGVKIGLGSSNQTQRYFRVRQW